MIIGNGNVALDVARILTGDPERLARTDIADHAPDRPRRQHHRGRHRDRPARTGPSRVLGQGNPQSGSDAGHLGRACRGTGTRPGQRRSGRWTAGIAGSLQARPARRSSAGSDTDRKITLRFLAEPVELVGRAGVEAIRLRRTELVATTTGDLRAVATDETEELACDLVFAPSASAAPRWRASRSTTPAGSSPTATAPSWIRTPTSRSRACTSPGGSNAGPRA